jgi:hypothetical protein
MTNEVAQEKDELDTWFDGVVEPEEANQEQAAAPEAPAQEDPEAPADKAEASGDDQPAEENNPFKWIDELPEEVREKAKALKEDYTKVEHSYQSQTGRVRSLQAQLDEERRRQAAAAKTPASGEQPETAEPETNKELAEKLEKYKKDYPDLVDLADAVSTNSVGSRLRAMEKLIEERVAPLQEELQTRRAQDARLRFEEKCADILNTKDTGVTYQEVLNSDAYADFLDSAPAYLRDIAHTSQDPDEAASVIEAFVKDQRIKMLEEQANAPEPKENERRKKLEQKVQPQSRSSAKNDSGGDDYNKWFDHYADN